MSTRTGGNKRANQLAEYRTAKRREGTRPSAAALGQEQEKTFSPGEIEKLAKAAYDSTPTDGGKSNWGEWEDAPAVVRSVHKTHVRTVLTLLGLRRPTCEAVACTAASIAGSTYCEECDREEETA